MRQLTESGQRNRVLTRTSVDEEHKHVLHSVQCALQQASWCNWQSKTWPDLWPSVGTTKNLNLTNGWKPVWQKQQPVQEESNPHPASIYSRKPCQLLLDFKFQMLHTQHHQLPHLAWTSILLGICSFGVNKHFNLEFALGITVWQACIAINNALQRCSLAFPLVF